MPINEQQLKSLSKEPKTEEVKQAHKSMANYEDILLENNKMLKKIIAHYRWQTFFSIFKILIFVVPIVLAYLYLTPVLNKVIADYQSAMNTVTGIEKEIKSVKTMNIFEQIQLLRGSK
jgi:hypothetical protein